MYRPVSNSHYKAKLAEKFSFGSVNDSTGGTGSSVALSLPTTMAPFIKQSYAFTVGHNSISGPLSSTGRKTNETPKKPHKAHDRSYFNSQQYDTSTEESSTHSPTMKGLLSPVFGRETKKQQSASATTYNWPPFATTASVQSQLSSITLVRFAL